MVTSSKALIWACKRGALEPRLVPVEERPAESIIGQNIELVIHRLRSPDAEVWTASTATAAAAGLGSTKYQGYILLSNGLIQRTPCDCTLRKFRLTTTSRVRASTYAWGPCSTGDADKACKNTQANQTQIK